MCSQILSGEHYAYHRCHVARENATPPGAVVGERQRRTIKNASIEVPVKTQEKEPIS